MKQVLFSYNHNTVNAIEIDQSQVRPTLDRAVYSLSFSKDSGYYLTYLKDEFKLPEQLFGSTNAKAKRVIQAFKNSDKSLGVLATGEKGSGKSLLMNKIANDSGLPIILINSPYYGESFDLFLSRLGECVLVFDEFGKNYSKQSSEENEGKGSQENLLSLFDGMTSRKRLVLLTENSEYLISEFILGRSGRVRYHFKYDKLEESIIREYCESVGVTGKLVTDLLKFVKHSATFSFDSLQTLVKEHLEFGDSLKEMLEYINLDGRDKTITTYKCLSFTNSSNGKSYEVNILRPDHPMGLQVYADNSSIREFFDIKDDFVKQEGNIIELNNERYKIVLEVTKSEFEL